MLIPGRNFSVMKKITSLFILLLALTSACTKCTTGDIRSAWVPFISNASVALVRRDGDGDVGAYCSGVWVSQSVILTAAHCTKNGENGFISYITKSVEPQIFEEPSAIFAASVRVVDEKHDLALLDTSIPFKHEFARLADLSPAVGDDIITVGSTIGLTWSVSGGNVGAYRARLKFMTDTEGPFMQIVSAAYFGNSGGGVFNMRGQLVGIVIEKTPAPTVSMAVHRATIRQLLIDNGV